MGDLDVQMANYYLVEKALYLLFSEDCSSGVSECLFFLLLFNKIKMSFRKQQYNDIYWVMYQSIAKLPIPPSPHLTEVLLCIVGK